MAEIFAESLYDAVLDCLKIMPVLFLAYLLVSYLSHDHSHKFGSFLAKDRKTSVLYASFLGCVPQCGFSSVIADLFSKKYVSLGTLIAVFVATSDEAIPIMLTNTDKILDIFLLIGVKILLALFWGYLIEIVVSFFVKYKSKNQKQGKAFVFVGQQKNPEHKILPQKEEHTHDCGHNHSHNHECGHHTEECHEKCGHKPGCCADNIFLDAFGHTFNIVIYIFVATLIINIIVGFFGTEVLEKILTTNMYSQILIASLIGLIPNCASSVLLVELYALYGTLSFPALVAGLSAGVGVGLIILWTKNKKHPLQNLGILIMQYAIGVVSGMFLTLFF